MSTILAFFGPDGILWALGGTVIIAFLVYVRSLGKQSAEAKQAREEAKARDISDEVENDVGALTPKQRQERLKSWGKS